MRLPPIPGPRDIVLLLERVTGLLGSAEQLLTSADSLVARIEQTRASADEVVARTDATVERADELVGRLDPVLVRTEATLARLDLLLGGFEPTLNTLLPILERLADTTETSEVDALVSLVDHLPLVVGKLEVDVLPILETLGTVAPDLHDLLDTSKELNEMLAKLPGMGRIKERVERQQEAQGRA